MTSDLRNLRKLVDVRKLALLPGDVDNRDRRLVDIFEQWWPECYESDFSGKVIMAPADAANLEELFDLFGVPLKVADNNLSALKRAFDVFALYGIGFQLETFMTLTEEELPRMYPRWPVDWVEYLKAVARADKETARRYAQKLQPLSPDCEYPHGCFIKKSPTP